MSKLRDLIEASPHWESWEAFQDAWANAKAPHPCIELAFTGCAVLCCYCIDALPKEDQDRIFVATLDAMPRGDDAAMEAAAEMLHSIAVTQGWEDYLGPQDDDEST